ncbi:MAG: hypothetical protein E2O48_01290, partial [Gemmatimonadetes bacterium]
MTDTSSSRGPGGKRKKSQATRKLSLALRVRTQLRQATDHLLGADVGWSLALVLVSLLLLGNQRCGKTIAPFVLGEIAPYDIVAPEELLVVDAKLTDERREHRRLAVADVYEHNSERAGQLVEEMISLFEEGRQRLVEGGDLDAALAPLSRLRFSHELQRSLSEAVGWSMRGLVVGNKAMLERAASIALIHLPSRR